MASVGSRPIAAGRLSARAVISTAACLWNLPESLRQQLGRSSL